MPESTTMVPDAEQKEKVRSFFDESKPWQGDLYGEQNDYFSRVIRRRKEYALEMIKALPVPRGGTALDIGCGSGVYLKELLSRGYEATGLDVSAEMLAVCKQRLGAGAEKGQRVHLVQGDVEHLPFPDNHFDLVLCIGVFGYLLSDDRAITEIRRVLKPEGHLLLNLTNLYSLSDADYVLRKKLSSLVRRRPSESDAAVGLDYAMPSDWMMKHRKYFFKAYNLPRYERLLAGRGFRKMDAMTYGFEFRILRRLHLVPARLLDRAELLLEKLVRRRSIPLLSYSGWVYTGVFTRL